MGFSGSSAGRESSCNAGDPGLILGWGRSPEEGTGLVTPAFMGFPRGSDGKESICLWCRRPGFDPWLGKIPWRMAWQPTPVFLPGESHRQRSLVGYSPWGHNESDTTERLSPAQHRHACGLPSWLSAKEAARNARDSGEAGSVPGSGRSPGGGHGNPLQCSWLENPKDRGTWQATVLRVTKNQRQLKQLSMHAYMHTMYTHIIQTHNVSKSKKSFAG